ncbi:MAG TPA: hypothetical protein VFU49_11375 [Ktedonobacteraceae bacterium]|nr:hypothetical protein [Ktedonobacteraceae bacterium]
MLRHFHANRKIKLAFKLKACRQINLSETGFRNLQVLRSPTIDSENVVNTIFLKSPEPSARTAAYVYNTSWLYQTQQRRDQLPG